MSKNGRVVQPQFAYKGLKGRAWLIQKLLSLTSLSKEMPTPITPGTYIIGFGEEFKDAMEKPYILTNNGEGKQLTVEPLSGELNQQVNL